MNAIRFRFSPAKALAALHWMVEQHRDLDLHTVLKACYFADKKHLNKHGRPIFGARYRAMRFGPVPIEIYEMAKGDPIWLAELGIQRFPWELHGYRLRMTGNRTPNLRALSASDRKELDAALKKSHAMTFNERTAATHGPDWQAAKLGPMRYEDMLDDGPEKAARVAYLREAGPHMRL